MCEEKKKVILSHLTKLGRVVCSYAKERKKKVDKPRLYVNGVIFSLARGVHYQLGQ